MFTRTKEVNNRTAALRRDGCEEKKIEKILDEEFPDRDDLLFYAFIQTINDRSEQEVYHTGGYLENRHTEVVLGDSPREIDVIIRDLPRSWVQKHLGNLFEITIRKVEP